MGLMDGKRVLIAGARNKWSIGWHCAASLIREGAVPAFSVYSERERDDVQKLAESAGVPDAPVFLCDATVPEQVDRLFEQVGEAFDGKLDALVHSIAFAPREALSGTFVDTTQTDFRIAMESSVYTLVALARGAHPLMKAAGGGAIVTLTYLGGERVVAKYNVMGVCKAALESSMRYLAYDLGPDQIRVNAVSAGPIKTLAAQGIQGFNSMLNQVAERCPLQRRVEADEVGDAALFLLSPWARGITGSVLFVDAGYNIMGM
ncbi:MAG: enoyl-ACP reductase [Chthonomonadales bacterium]|nr:enoyl-ACP reductase [Chthonomonadales bacterium]